MILALGILVCERPRVFFSFNYKIHLVHKYKVIQDILSRCPRLWSWSIDIGVGSR
jgi:hypothetical protein